MYFIERERRLGPEEGAYALSRFGNHAEMILLMRAQQTRSSHWRNIFLLAISEVRRLRSLAE